MTTEPDLQTTEMTGAEGEADPTLGIGHRTEDNQTTETNNLGTMDIKTGIMTFKIGTIDFRKREERGNRGAKCKGYGGECISCSK